MLNSTAPCLPAKQGSLIEPMMTKEIKQARSIQELEDIFDEWSGSMKFIQATATFNRAAHLTMKTPKLLPIAHQFVNKRVLGLWQRVMPGAEPRNLASVLWSCGRLQYADESLWSETLQMFIQNLNSANSYDIANAVHGMASIAVVNNGMVPGLSRDDAETVIAECLGQFYVLVTHPYLEGIAAQDISNIIWACA